MKRTQLLNAIFYFAIALVVTVVGILIKVGFDFVDKPHYPTMLTLYVIFVFVDFWIMGAIGWLHFNQDGAKQLCIFIALFIACWAVSLVMYFIGDISLGLIHLL
jgi:hypothetical protein